MNSRPVAIINESLARQAFADRDPIGQRLQLGAGLGAEYADRRESSSASLKMSANRASMHPQQSLYSFRVRRFQMRSLR